MTVLPQEGLAPNGLYYGAAGEYAGNALAVGDINGDGVADLIVSARYATALGRPEAGTVYVIYNTTDIGAVNLTALSTGNGMYFVI